MSTVQSWILSYLLNSLWQVPLLFAAGWLAARALRPLGAAAEHRVWVGVLLAQTLLPACSTLPPELFRALVRPVRRAPRVLHHGAILHRHASICHHGLRHWTKLSPHPACPAHHHRHRLRHDNHLFRREISLEMPPPPRSPPRIRPHHTHRRSRTLLGAMPETLRYRRCGDRRIFPHPRPGRHRPHPQTPPAARNHDRQLAAGRPPHCHRPRVRPHAPQRLPQESVLRVAFPARQLPPRPLAHPRAHHGDPRSRLRPGRRPHRQPGPQLNRSPQRIRPLSPAPGIPARHRHAHPHPPRHRNLRCQRL